MGEAELWDELVDLEADMRQAHSTASALLQRADLTPYQREVLGKIEALAKEAAFEAGCLQPVGGPA